MTISLAQLVLGGSSSSYAPNIEDLTTGALNGTGVFDKLMAVVTLHIAEEFNKGRITGKDFATVYLGGMSAVLEASIAFLTSGKEVEKLNAEIALLRQKTVTELAQTDGDIPFGLGFNNGTTVSGTVDRQNKLYEAQTAGFARDAEQKLAKILVDTWSVRRTTDDGTQANTSNGLADSNILSVLDKARAGIGL